VKGHIPILFNTLPTRMMGEKHLKDHCKCAEWSN
jgi:hypothetical protein